MLIIIMIIVIIHANKPWTDSKLHYWCVRKLLDRHLSFEHVPEDEDEHEEGEGEDVSRDLVHHHHSVPAPLGKYHLPELCLLRQVQQFVDDGELDETEEHKDDAGGHPDVYGLGVGDRGETLLGLSVLSGECEQARHSQRHPGRGALGRDPETDPAHHHDQHGGDVGGEEEVAGVPLQLEDSRQAGEGPGGVVDGAVLRPEGLYLQLRQPEQECQSGEGREDLLDVGTDQEGLNTGTFQNKKDFWRWSYNTHCL